jgi:hypothetical protein
MNQTDLTSTALPEGGPAASRQTKAAAPRFGWTAGRIAAIAGGVLLGLVSLGLLVGAGVGLWADFTQRDSGYVTTGVHEFSTSESALATEPTELGSAGVGWMYAPGLLDEVRIRVTPTDAGSPLFVGIGRSKDVDRYLAGVRHTLISDFWENRTETVDGSSAVAAPSTQAFWAASSSGSGTRSLEWDPVDGSWTVVVMKADGQPGIDVEADLGARMPALRWIALGALVLGAAFMAGGALLIVGAIRRRRADRPQA